MKIKIAILSIFLLIIPATIFADIDIVVQDSINWPEKSTEDIKMMCNVLISQFQKHLRPENKVKNLKINIQYGDPRIEYRPWDPDTQYIFLSVSGEWWQEQLFYQFGHEFCHILHNHGDFGVNHPNKWFYESLCMMASIWVMNDMAENWSDISPKKEWNQWGEWIKIYADTNKNTQERQFRGTGKEWLNKFEQFLRDDADNHFTHHSLVAQLSYKFFLSIFEENPESWNAIRQMPTSKNNISEYMKDWHKIVDSQDKKIVEDIAEAIGIEIQHDLANNTISSGEYISLSLENVNSLRPENNPNEWDGWIMGIWEKYDGIINEKPPGYLNFAEMKSLSHWIYSHAPSNIVYNISNLNANSFGSYFLLTNPTCGNTPSMKLTAKADGVKIYSKEFFLQDYGKYIEFEIPYKTKIFSIEIDDMGNNACDHYVLGEPKLYTNNNSIVKDQINADVNNDGYVDLSDVLIVRSAIKQDNSYNTDINGDGITNEIDVLLVKAKAVEAIAAAAPSKRRIKLTTWGVLKSQ